jgi:hypothetical protein
MATRSEKIQECVKSIKITDDLIKNWNDILVSDQELDKITLYAIELTIRGAEAQKRAFQEELLSLHGK